jgi:two-component system, NarL family, nitrate/nitrite response regulator NarL
VTSVAVCDMEPIAIEGLRSLLESTDDRCMVAAESSLADGIAAVEELKPSVLFLDKSFGLEAVLDWLKRLQRANFRTAVVVWSRLITEPEALRFLQSGASGVIRKTASLETLLSCLDTVVSGATWTEERLFSEPDPGFRPARSPLTARELQVIELVERGMKNKDIAAELGIRTGTVKIHLKHIFEKTGIRGRYGLALSGMKEKIPLIPVAM